MLGATSLVLGVIVTVLFGSWRIRRCRGGSSDRRDSWKRHRDAQTRVPPVDLGETHRVVVEDFSEHHTGERHAVCKVEGFVVFVEDLPGGLAEGDVIRAEVRSFNRGHTSASATYVGRE